MLEHALNTLCSLALQLALLRVLLLALLQVLLLALLRVPLLALLRLLEPATIWK